LFKFWKSFFNEIEEDVFELFLWLFSILGFLFSFGFGLSFGDFLSFLNSFSFGDLGLLFSFSFVGCFFLSDKISPSFNLRDLVDTNVWFVESEAFFELFIGENNVS